MKSLLASKFRHRMVRMVCAFGMASAMLGPACADEGVWTFDSPPARALQSGYGFAPEARLGAFGGDSDNFVFPRFGLDFSLLRVYEKGEAIKPTHFLKRA